MKKFYCILFSLIFVINANSQEFLYNDDYVYGAGITDSAAMVSLASTIKTNIVNEINYTISESNKRITEDYKKDIKLSSSLLIEGAKLYLTGDNKGNTIYYRYINRKQYIDNQIDLYNYYLSEIERIKGSNCKHEINLLLGYYYLAYQALDTPLMTAFCGDKYASIKNEIINRASILYVSKEYGYLCLNQKKWYGYTATMAGRFDVNGDSQPIDLIGFEYFLDNEWKSSDYFSTEAYQEVNISKTPNDNMRYRMCILKSDNSKIRYRKLYETYCYGFYTKIEVPESWYFKELFMGNPNFLN